MVNVYVRHRIQDYTTWKQVFDGFASKRRAGGEQTYKVARVVGNPTIFVYPLNGTTWRTPNASLPRPSWRMLCSKPR